MVSAISVPVMLLLIPIFDTTLVTVARLLSGRRASSGGKDHTSHRLVAMGFSEREAVLILWLLAAAGGAVALLSRFFSETAVLAPLLLIGLVLLGIQLARVRVYDGEDFSALVRNKYTPLLVEVTYRRRLFELVLDVILVAVCYYAAYAIRFDAELPQYTYLFLQSLPIVIGSQILSFVVVGVYRSTWRYIGLGDLGTFAKGIALGTVSSVIVLVYLYHFEGYSRGVFVIYALAAGACVVGARLSERVLADLAGRHRQAGKRALVYGAGDGAALLLKELRSNPSYDFVPLALLDDDPSKHGKRIHQLLVLGGAEQLRDVIEATHAEVLIVSTSSLPASGLRGVALACQESGIPLMQFRIGLRRIEVQDTMPREWPVAVDRSA
jgi:UDP-GlcNAc:undecaprenyl-phosphate GlcNAc-1-phosphate transferase